MNLKQAREKNELEQFIKEHENDPDGDQDKLDEAIRRLSDMKKSAQETSEQDSSER